MEKRIKNVTQLKKCYEQNIDNQLYFHVVGQTNASLTVQNMCYLYDLNNKNLCETLDKILNKYEVVLETYEVVSKRLDISNIPEEICMLINDIALEKQEEAKEKKLKFYREIRNELKNIEAELDRILK